MTEKREPWRGDGNAVKDLETLQAESIQQRARPGEDVAGFSLFTFLATGYGLVSAWWTPQRDYDLARFWKSSPHLSGTYHYMASKLASVPFRVEPRDPSVASHRKLAEKYQQRAEEESEFGAGWFTLWTRALIDRWTQDNGLFIEVIGEGSKDGPIMGPALGLANLDAARCTRTGDVEYPVIYADTDGYRYKLHRTRVIFGAEMPDPRAEMYGVGYSWTSRVLDVAQTMIDILTYKEEKLGSRPARMLGITQGGLDPQDVQSAFDQAAHVMDSQHLSRFSKYVIAGDRLAPEAGIQMLDLASLPDGFDERTSVMLGMNVIALAGGFPVRWIWPASVSGETKAEAESQHITGLKGGPGATLYWISNVLGGAERGRTHSVGKFLPPTLRLVFDFQDDEQDRKSAEISGRRAETRERDLASGVTSLRVAREGMLENGELTEAQFEELELEDGRLADGSDVLTLFNSPEPFFRDVLALGVADPLDVGSNDADVVLAAAEQASLDCMAIAGNPSNASEKHDARRALAALKALQRLYQDEGEQEEEVDEPVPQQAGPGPRRRRSNAW